MTGLDTARSGSATLATGAKQLSDGINQATDPLIAVTKALSQIGGNTDQLQQGATALQQANDQIGAIATAQDSAANSLSSVIDQLSARQDPLANNLRGIQDQLRGHQFTPQIRQRLTDAQNAAINMTSGLRTPRQPAGLRARPSRQQESGSDGKLTQLRDGAQQVASGNAQLASGIAKLDDGAQSTEGGLSRAGHQAGRWRQASSRLDDPAEGCCRRHHRRSRFNSTPHMRTPRPTSAPAWPRSSSPWPCSSVRWCCGWCCGPLQSRAIAAEVLAIRVVLASYLPAAAIAVFQAIILYCVVRFGLGMHVVHPVSMLAFMILISCAFVAATQAINALVGPAVGRVLIMALLMLQLVSAGGMYPVETTSKPFQVLHRFDPMTYGVNGLRQLILGGIDARLWQAVIVLFGIWAVALAISSLSARRHQLWNLERLIPAIRCEAIASRRDREPRDLVQVDVERVEHQRQAGVPVDHHQHLDGDLRSERVVHRVEYRLRDGPGGQQLGRQREHREFCALEMTHLPIGVGQDGVDLAPLTPAVFATSRC